MGPITPELSDALADHMNIRRGEVHEVVSFYSFLQVPIDTPRVCTGPVCDCFGARELLDRTPGAIEVACLGHCDLAPVMTRGDEVVPEVTHSTNDGPAIGLGQRDETLDDYAARGGLDLLRELPSRDRIVTELKAAGITGFGGAGFPTGIKWEAVSREPGPRYVVVNADEGEPGTIKDRFVMELRPHLFLEGTLVAMRFAEAEQGYIYLREEYATARHRLQRAIDEYRAAGLLEGSSLELVIGAGAYIAGEETSDARVDGGTPRDAATPPSVPGTGRLPRPADPDQQRRDACTPRVHIPTILPERCRQPLRGTRARRRVRLTGHDPALWSRTPPRRGEAPVDPRGTERGCTQPPAKLVDEHDVADGCGKRCDSAATSSAFGVVEVGGGAGSLPPAALVAPSALTGSVRLGTRRRTPIGRGAGSPASLRSSPALLARYRKGRCVLPEVVVPENDEESVPISGTRAIHHLVLELENDRAAMRPARSSTSRLSRMAKTSIGGLG